MHSFHDLELKTLKKICSKYNLHIKITRYSKLSKDELIPHMEKHLHINSEGKIKMKKEVSETAETEINKMLHELKNKVKEVKEKVIKHHAKKAEHKPEEKKKKEIHIEEKKEKKTIEQMEKEKNKKEMKEYHEHRIKKIDENIKFYSDDDYKYWKTEKPEYKREFIQYAIYYGYEDEIKKYPIFQKYYEKVKNDGLLFSKKYEDEKKQEKKIYDYNTELNKEEKEFRNSLRDRNNIHRPENIKKSYNENFIDKNIEDYYIYIMNNAKDESLEEIQRQIDDKHSEHHLQVKIDELNQKINNSINAFKTKKAQKKADERIEEWRNEKHPKERELQKYNKIRDIQKENYKKLKDMKIETVKDANDFADLIKASNYLNLSYRYDAELKKKDEEHKEFINSLGKKIDEEEKEMKPKKEIQIEEKTPVDKIEKMENIINKLENIMNINEKENKKEHKELQKEITEIEVSKMKIKELKELAKKHNISTTHKVNNKDVSKSAPMLKKELIEKIPMKKSKINKSMTKKEIYDIFVDKMDDKEKEEYLKNATLKEVQFIARLPSFNVKLTHSNGKPKSKERLIEDIEMNGGQN